MPNDQISNRLPSQVSGEERAQILAEAETGDVSIAEVARRHDVNPDDVYRWRHRDRQRSTTDEGQRFIPVDLISSISSGVVLRSVSIEFSNDVSFTLSGPVPASQAQSRYRTVGGGMIGPGAGTRIYLACGGTDMRRGFDGLSAQVQKSLSLDPFNGAVFVFRGKRGDRVKLLSLSWFASKPLPGNGWDGQGFCLFYKRLEKGRFVWPQTQSGTAHLTSAQLSMLLEGIDWRRPQWTSRPTRSA